MAKPSNRAPRPTGDEFAAFGSQLAALLLAPLAKTEVPKPPGYNALMGPTLLVDDIGARLEELRRLATNSSVGVWLGEQDPFRDMDKSLHRLGRRKPKFATALAPYRLIRAASASLAIHCIYVEERARPAPPTDEDWQAGISAVKCLARLRDRGVTFSRAVNVNGSPWNAPYDWLEQIEERIQATKAVRPRTYADSFSTDRHATREFTVWLLAVFDEAPPVLVEHFGCLIGYESDGIRKHVRSWTNEYRMNLLV